MGRAHEWDVIGEGGRIRFVESDDSGVPADIDRYEAFRAAEARGELAYRGLIDRPVDNATLVEPPDESGRSYAQNVIDAAEISNRVPGGTMGMYRDL